MNTKNLIIVATLCSLLVVSCQQADLKSESSVASYSKGKAELAISEVERAIIKTASIEVSTNNVEQSIDEIKSKVNAMNGHIFHYEIKSNKNYISTIEKNLDSSVIHTEVSPTAFIKLKVPSSQSDTFISYLLNMNMNIDNLQLDEQDITEDLSEQKDLASMNEAGTAVTSNVKNLQFDKDFREEQIRRKAEIARMNQKTKYLWFDVSLKGLPFTESKVVATSSNYRTPFYVGALKALDSGWYGFSMFLILLLNLWPLLLILGIIFIAWRKKWLHKIDLKSSYISQSK